MMELNLSERDMKSNQELAIMVNKSADTGCFQRSPNLYELLLQTIENVERGQEFNINRKNNCSEQVDELLDKIDTEMFVKYQVGRAFYSYFTPVILIIGILGNSLSLNVFLSKNMRSLSASTYLAALSASDLFTLVFYVTVEWLRRGLVYISNDVKMPFLDYNGICQAQLYLSYVSRLVSVWLVVAFTVERYIGICHPLRRRDICTTKSTRKIVASIFVVSALLVTYKPFLSGVFVSPNGRLYCTGNPDYGFPSFILDSIFGVMITLVPFIVITVLNILIIRKLFVRNKRQKACRIITEESIIRLEFTIILLAISFCFIAFNVPYFAVWCRNFLHSNYISNSETIQNINFKPVFEYWKDVLYITRTIFYMNYCINFFLYSITGAYFRQEVKMLFALRSKPRFSYTHCQKSNSNSHTPKSWV